MGKFNDERIAEDFFEGKRKQKMLDDYFVEGQEEFYDEY